MLIIASTRVRKKEKKNQEKRMKKVLNVKCFCTHECTEHLSFRINSIQFSELRLFTNAQFNLIAKQGNNKQKKTHTETINLKMNITPSTF